MIPKIGDFGISRLPADSMQTCVTENISGTLGYMPPGYVFKKQISPKFDIFSLGVIMIHIIAGHEGNQNYPYMPSQEFIELVHENWRKQLQATVPRHTLEQVRTCTKLALRCVEFDREKRPDIREIIDELNKVDADGTSDTGQNTEEEEHTALDKQPETEEQEEETEHLEYKKNTQVNSRYTRAYHMLESVDLATGSLGSLLSKVLLLIQDYRTLSVELGYLCKELEFMQDSLQKVAVVPLDQLDGAVKLWANEARDLSYAMENIVDSYLMSFPPPKSNFMDQAILAIRRIKDRRELLHMINGIIKNIQKMNNRRRRQNAEIVCYRISPSAADPCLSALNKDPEEMVGVEVSRDEVIRKLTHGTDGVSKQLNIVSIVGMAGLGKTTLARAVYGRVQEQFDCSAFVSVSQHPDMKKVLMEILCQIDKKFFMEINVENFEGRMPIDELWILLADKRYLIVIDDLWDIRSWEIIKSVLVGGRNGSNIVTTTRIFEVAEKAGGVYKLKAISRQHSEELFNKRLYAGKGNVHDVPENLLERCGGVPLAIITMASLLAKKPRVDWSKVQNSSGFGYGCNEDVENMRKTLLLSYYDLPYHLRACLLHLNIFPQDYSIRKEALIWMWVAEGFVHGEVGAELFKLGEVYFHELINRSLLIPIEDSSRCIINGCRLHDMVHDMISFLSAENNFLTVLNGSEKDGPVQGIVHRVAFLTTTVKQDDPLTKECTGETRSFNTIKCHFGMRLPISRFKVIRVLSIEECTFMEGRTCDLKHLGKLLHLRYLGFYNTPIHQLPEEVGSLYMLQTMDLRGTSLRELPFSVSRLSHLKCLRADETTRVPDWIGNLTSLEQLSLDYASTSVNFVIELGKLKRLRELDIWMQELDEISNKAFLESLRNLDCMEVLRLMSNWHGKEANWDSYVPPGQLRELFLSIALPRLPSWIDVSVVPNLSHLSVDLRAVDQQDVDMLGYLPELISLDLQMPSDAFLNIKGNNLFPKLRRFDTSASFKFLPGAMQALELLHFEVNVRALKRVGIALDDFASLENLLRLQSVEVEINTRGTRAVHATESEEAVKRTVDNHPSNLTLSIKKT